MDGVNEEYLSLDDIIKLKNIQAPTNTGSGKFQSTSIRGRGFGRLVPMSSSDTQSNEVMIEAAYKAGLAAGVRASYAFDGFQRRGGGGRRSTNIQRGGFHQRMGNLRMGNLRTGIPRLTPGVQLPYQSCQRAVPGLNGPSYGTQFAARVLQEPSQGIPRTAPGRAGTSHESQLTVSVLAGPSHEIQRAIPELQKREVAVFHAPEKHRPDLVNIEISIPAETVGKPALRDRLGWYPWQRLTPAQQAARSKLSLAKMRLNRQRPAGFGSRLPGDRTSAKRRLGGHPGRLQLYGQRRPANLTPLEDGVSPLLRQNVARLPGDAAGLQTRSVKSFSAVSHHSRGTATSRIRCRQNNTANKAYLAERQFDDNNTDFMSAYALQERMRPNVPYGKYNRCGVHVPMLDPRMQQHIAEIQQKGRSNPVQSAQDFEYAAMVVATQTSSSDRFTLMMSLGQPSTSARD